MDVLSVAGMEEILKKRAEGNSRLQRQLLRGGRSLSEQRIMDLYVRWELGGSLPPPITRRLAAGGRKPGSHGERKHR